MPYSNNEVTMPARFDMSLEEFAEMHRRGFNVEFDPVVMPLIYMLKAGKAQHMMHT